MKNFILLLALFSLPAFAHDPTTELQLKDYQVARKFNVFNRLKLKQLNRKKAAQIDIDWHANMVAKALEDPKSLEAGKALDFTIAQMVDKTSRVFEGLGDLDSAQRIETEYKIRFAYFNENFNTKEMGDHEHLSEWLLDWHNKIHNKIGDELCKFFHTHDLFIINYSIPVVRAPESFDLPEYSDHFAGHMSGPYSFVHHGLAGVVTYWSVNAACSVGTYGMGDIVFACSPISSLAEFAMDKYISPKLALKVWTRYH
jgi:hypothetical protein